MRSSAHLFFRISNLILLQLRQNISLERYSEKTSLRSFVLDNRRAAISENRSCATSARIFKAAFSVNRLSQKMFWLILTYPLFDHGLDFRMKMPIHNLGIKRPMRAQVQQSVHHPHAIIAPVPN